MKGTHVKERIAYGILQEVLGKTNRLLTFDTTRTA
jgi:hypothetical protein